MAAERRVWRQALLKLALLHAEALARASPAPVFPVHDVGGVVVARYRKAKKTAHAVVVDEVKREEDICLVALAVGEFAFELVEVLDVFRLPFLEFKQRLFHVQPPMTSLRFSRPS